MSRCDLRTHRECDCTEECIFIRADAISALYRSDTRRRRNRRQFIGIMLTSLGISLMVFAALSIADERFHQQDLIEQESISHG